MFLLRVEFGLGAQPMFLRTAFEAAFVLPNLLAAQAYGFLGRLEVGLFRGVELRMVDHGIPLPML